MPRLSAGTYRVVSDVGTVVHITLRMDNNGWHWRFETHEDVYGPFKTALEAVNDATRMLTLMKFGEPQTKH